jgi:RNA polymerase sigma-70 factor (ECF subfamily)
MHNSPLSDAQAVAAIRDGDRDRYRELVDRYGAKVFAVAWCRLGDRGLAEEATQEAFIHGYRQLALLGNAEKFGAWITTLARNAAINLGLRHRSELDRRERWALEQTPSAKDEQDEPLSAETVRAALASLAPIHRECLVLFYLENRSVTEAAALLGVSESAFKVRLHRGRAALRTLLETHLESSLEQLRPSTALGSLVMLALPSGKPGVSLAGTLLASMVNALPLKVGVFFLQMFSFLPGLLLSWWIGRKEAANFRDQAGFRVANYNRYLKGAVLFTAVIFAAIFGISRAIEPRMLAQVAGVTCMVYAVATIKPLYLVRHRLAVGYWLGILILTAALIGMGFFAWPLSTLYALQGCFFLVMSVTLGDNPVRVDTSLFLRAANHLLPTFSSPEVEPRRRYHLSELLAFGRFLGNHMLIVDWCARASALQVRLAPVTPSSLHPYIWGRSSRLTLQCDGQVIACLGATDLKSLQQLGQSSLTAGEKQVAEAVARALAAFAAQDFSRAEMLLGEEGLKTIYQQLPAKSFAVRSRCWVLRGCGVLMIGYAFWAHHTFSASR